jgi:hypothetical protein
MKRLFLFAFLLASVGVTVTSCFPEDENTYAGPTLIEFKNHTLGVTSTVLTARGIVISPSTQVQTDSTRYIMQNVRTSDTIYVQMIGRQQPTATTVPFTVRASSDAVAGTHYNFDASNSGNTVTIPANSSVGFLIVKPVANSVPVGSLRGVFIDLAKTGTFKPSPNYSKFKLYIKG